jgi:REP-associated tyrosine transposase
LTTARYQQGVINDGWLPFDGRLWQRNYHDRIVRDEDELTRIREYILNNPASWATDPNNRASADAG